MKAAICITLASIFVLTGCVQMQTWRRAEIHFFQDFDGTLRHKARFYDFFIPASYTGDVSQAFAQFMEEYGRPVTSSEYQPETDSVVMFQQLYTTRDSLFIEQQVFWSNAFDNVALGKSVENGVFAVNIQTNYFSFETNGAITPTDDGVRIEWSTDSEHIWLNLTDLAESRQAIAPLYSAWEAAGQPDSYDPEDWTE